MKPLIFVSKKLGPWLKKAILIGVFSSIAYVFFNNSKSIDWNHILNSPKYFFLAFLFCLSNCIGSFYIWYYLVRRNSTSANQFRSYELYTISSLAKYLPAGKLFQFGSFFQFTEDPFTAINSTIAMTLLTLCSLIAGGIILLVSSHYVIPDIPKLAVALMLSILVASIYLISLPKVTCLLFRILRKQNFYHPDQTGNIKARHLVATVGMTIVFGWIVDILACILLIWIVEPSFPIEKLWYITGAYAIASMSGYISIIAPSGLGVREGVMMFLLSKQLEPATAAFLCLTLRCCQTLADIFFSVPFLIKLTSIRISRKEAKLSPPTTAS